jgi:uncharacterized repeat protein (TIGR01451 family)
MTPASAAPATVEVEVDCDTGMIRIVSSKDISNIVYEVDGVETKIEFDDVETKTYELPLDSITTIWVKSGNNKSGDGPGYGERFPIESDQCVPETTLAVEKSGPPAVFADQEFEFLIEVTNTGGDTASNVVVVDNLPAEGSFVSSDPAATPVGSVLTLAIGDVAAGETVEVVVTWQAPSTEAVLVNEATVQADNATGVGDDHAVEVGIQTVVTGGVTAVGTGLRNRAGGTVSVTDVPPGAQVTRAVLTWAVLYNADVPNNQIGFEGETITADLTQTISNNLCWGDTNTIGFAADVTGLVEGNGDYSISDPINGLVRVDSNPVGTLPYTDGATLVVFYGGPGIDEQVLSDFTYSAENEGSNERSLTGITSTGGAATLWLAGPDGQNNAGEQVSVIGAGTLDLDNTWDGSDPQDGPDFTIGNLWDTDVHDVSSLVPVGQTTLDISLGDGPDCTGISVVALQVEQ